MSSATQRQSPFLSGLPEARIRACYDAAAGNEFQSGKFESSESSAALVANAFGYFLNQPECLPPLPRTEKLHWPASSIDLEVCMRFPWSGGRHPYLDVSVETDAELIGIESKRLEPFRDRHKVDFSEAYRRPVWGEKMGRFETMLDALADGRIAYRHLDACQLVKHAFGLRSEVVRNRSRKKAFLYYLFAEPVWAESTGNISPAVHRQHREETSDFARQVAGDEVGFISCSYGEVLTGWRRASEHLARHAAALESRFAPA